MYRVCKSSQTHQDCLERVHVNGPCLQELTDTSRLSRKDRIASAFQCMCRTAGEQVPARKANKGNESLAHWLTPI